MDLIWCFRTIRVHSTIRIDAIRCRCCQEMSARMLKKEAKVMCSFDLSSFCHRKHFVVCLFIHSFVYFRWTYSYNAAIGTGSIDSFERWVPDAIQVDEWKEESNHTRWCTWICCGRGKNLYSVLGMMIATHRFKVRPLTTDSIRFDFMFS